MTCKELMFGHKQYLLAVVWRGVGEITNIQQLQDNKRMAGVGDKLQAALIKVKEGVHWF